MEISWGSLEDKDLRAKDMEVYNQMQEDFSLLLRIALKSTSCEAFFRVKPIRGLEGIFKLPTVPGDFI